MSNPNTGLSQAQLQSCLYSHHPHGRQPSTRTSNRGLPTDAHPTQQPSSRQQPSARESPPLPAISTVSQLSNTSTVRGHSSVPSSNASFHSLAASEPCGVPLVAMQQQQGAAESGNASRVPDRLALQECLQSHGLQSALRTHTSLGAG